MILGTAGHIDHGKTALVRALTGVDTDRLPEEKRRGITIELGFAPLEVEGIGTVGVVDVPGHEAFVRTMLAGATGIDLALLVIAADEGVMPQTREHVAILQLLGVRAGVVALTKSDLAEGDWMDLVESDVRDLLAGSFLAGAPIVRCSARTGDGLDALRAALANAARAVPGREASDLFRMPIDRAFTVKGTGTVVTGTVWSGTVAVDDVVMVRPGGITARVRGIESHGAARRGAHVGARAAIALGSVDRHAVASRGSVLVKERDPWNETTLLRADVTLLGGVGRIGPRTRVRFHLGTADVAARLVAAGGPVAEGTPVPVRVSLDEPVVARAGDRFVIRNASPAATIGGGVVTDAAPGRRRVKPFPFAGADAGQRLAWMLAEAAGQGVETSTLPVRLGARPSDVDALLGSAAAVRLGGRAFSRGAVSAVADRVIATIEHHHAANPLEPGVPLQSLRSAARAADVVVDEAVRQLAEGGRIEVRGALAAMTGWMPATSGADAAKLERVANAIRKAGLQPPSVSELVEEFGADTPAVLKLLASRGEAVAVASDRYFSSDAVASITAAVKAALAGGAERTTSELREMTGLTRKYIIPLLEYLDAAGVTVRRGDVRRLGKHDS